MLQRAAADVQEQHRLVEKHRPLVFGMAKRIYRCESVPEDAISEGMLGLVIASHCFDASRGFQFITYATHWVRAMILDYLVRSCGQVRIGKTRAQRKAFFGLGRARRKVGDDPDAIAAELGIARGDVDLMAARLSKSDPSVDDDTATPLRDETGGRRTW